MAVILRCLKIRIFGCRFLSRELLRRLGHLPGVLCSGFLFRRWLGFYAVRTVKGGVAAVHLVIHDRAIDVGVMNDGGVHSRYGGVVMENVSFPAAAPVAISPIAVTVINATVKTDSRPPVTCVKSVNAVVPTPPRGGPQQADARWSNPDARHTIITTSGSTPVSGSPDVAWRRSQRLLVYRQNRWSDVDRYAYLRERGRKRQCCRE